MKEKVQCIGNKELVESPQDSNLITCSPSLVPDS